MKKTLFSLSLIVSLASPLAAQTAGGNLTLNGTINGYEGKYIHLFTSLGEQPNDDSVKIANGKFAFTTKLSNKMEMGALLIGNMQDYQNAKYCQIYLEPGTMTIALDKDNFRKPVVTGSFTQAQADSLTAIDDAIMAEAKPILAEMDTCQDSKRHAELMDMLEPYQGKVKAANTEWVKAHPASYISPMQLRFLTGDLTYEETKSIYDSFTPELKAMPESKEIADELAVLAKVRPGLAAPLFRAKNWKGVEEGIADLKGKYVILDFWATWCMPCRKSFPHVKSLYEKYKSKGLDVFCVADDDGNEDKWKAAIEKDGIQQFHHVLRGLVWDRSKGMDGMDKTNDISDKYAIHYLPTKYLIDDKGCIVGKFNDEELDAKLKEIFGF